MNSEGANSFGVYQVPKKECMHPKLPSLLF